MTTTIANRPICVGQDKISVVDQALREAFGVRFDLWTLADAWVQVSGYTTPDLGYSTALAEVLDEMDERETEPRVVQLSDDRSMLILPLCRDRQVAIVAAAVFHISPPELLVKCAKLFLTCFAQREEIERLQSEGSSLVKQVSEDFEELTFLRRIADYLEVSDMSQGLIRMAEFVFPLLNDRIRAESLWFISADSERNISADSEHRAVVRIGPRVLDENVAMRLVDLWSSETRLWPLVKNGFDTTQNAADFPEIRNFVLVSVGATNSVLGWLLAVNRQAAGAPTTDTADPQLVESFEFGSVEASLLSTSASILGAYGRNYMLLREKEQLLVNMVRVMVSTIEAKDAYTCGHSERVALFAERLAKELVLSAAECERLYLTGLLHDIGKIGVPDELLLKESGLTEQEYEHIKRHPDQGWKILHGLEQLRYVIPGVLYHHEHFDGSGYPDGLAGEDIPLDGRILAVADTYDAMTSDRPYRKGVNENRVIEILRAGAGKQWDPRVVAALLSALPDITRIRESYQRPPQPCRASKQRDAADNAGNIAIVGTTDGEPTIEV